MVHNSKNLSHFLHFQVLDERYSVSQSQPISEMSAFALKAPKEKWAKKRTNFKIKVSCEVSKILYSILCILRVSFVFSLNSGPALKGVVVVTPPRPIPVSKLTNSVGKMVRLP